MYLIASIILLVYLVHTDVKNTAHIRRGLLDYVTATEIFQIGDHKKIYMFPFHCYFYVLL